MGRVYNFSAGPAVLPEEVLKEAVNIIDNYESKLDYKKAFDLFLIGAEDGRLYAQEKLGDMYYEGEYVKKNYTKALEWYKKAAEQGSLYGKIASIEIEQMDIKGEL